MAKPAKTPEWASDPTAEVIEPTAGKKASGWVAEQPPHEYFNWLLKLAWQWFAWIDERLFDGSAAGRLGVKGLDSTPTAGHGVEATGAAGGAGVYATASVGSPAGVVGLGDGLAPGVLGNAGPGATNAGVVGLSAAAGYFGVDGSGSGTPAVGGGVRGRGTGADQGGLFTAETGTAVEGISDDGRGVVAQCQNGTLAALRVVPQGAPGSATTGDVYYDFTTNKLRVYTPTGWVDLH